MMPMGFEYALRKPLHVVPNHTRGLDSERH